MVLWVKGNNMSLPANANSSVRSTLGWGMHHTGTELSSLPCSPLEFGAIPAIQRGNEVQPNKNADDYDDH